jgi:hypothetical protein
MMMSTRETRPSDGHILSSCGGISFLLCDRGLARPLTKEARECPEIAYDGSQFTLRLKKE